MNKKSNLDDIANEESKKRKLKSANQGDIEGEVMKKVDNGVGQEVRDRVDLAIIVKLEIGSLQNPIDVDDYTSVTANNNKQGIAQKLEKEKILGIVPN